MRLMKFGKKLQSHSLGAGYAWSNDYRVTYQNSIAGIGKPGIYPRLIISLRCGEECKEEIFAVQVFNPEEEEIATRTEGQYGPLWSIPMDYIHFDNCFDFGPSDE